MGFSILKQPSSLQEMPQAWRWTVLMLGLLETALWSGTIFGWATLVHIMKTEGVYSHLCQETDGEETMMKSLLEKNETSASNHVYASQSLEDDGVTLEQAIYSCRAQDEQFTLIGTVALVLYTLPGILIGYALHYMGQAFTRITASLLISAGFVLLSFTSKENPDFLWGGSILFSVGGNMIRVACLEFGNLFPKRRSTVMALISGIYTISAALFMVMQSAHEAGYRWGTICLATACGASFIIATTLIMPRCHIPCDDDLTKTDSKQPSKEMSAASKHGDNAEKSTKKTNGVSDIPLSKSLLSLSMITLQFWLFTCMFSVTIFSTYFNSWINRFSKDTEEAAHYSRLFGYANIFCVFTGPLAGIVIDFLTSIFRRGKSGIEEKVAYVQATLAPTFLISFTVTVQISCFLFFSSWAVYVGLVCLIINRPSCLGIGIPFLRSRFPADHFNRLIGIQGTFISIMSTLQYPHFTWTQSNYYTAISVVVGLLALSIIHPLHLLNKKYMYRVLDHS